MPNKAINSDVKKFRCAPLFAAGDLRRALEERIHMAASLESEFHEAMLNIYRKAKSEAKYNAIRFLEREAGR